jgi:hypothetical protein
MSERGALNRFSLPLAEALLRLRPLLVAGSPEPASPCEGTPRGRGAPLQPQTVPAPAEQRASAARPRRDEGLTT